MSLNASNGLMKIDGDSSGAVKALENVKKSATSVAESANNTGSSITAMVKKYGGLASGLAGVGSAVMVAKDAMTQFMDASRASADLFSQFGEAGWAAAAAVNQITNAADNMIKVQTAASAYNRLVNGDMKMTEEGLENLAKMSVDLARKYGKSADDMMNELSMAIAGGELSALRRYGIVLDETEANLEANKKAMAEFGRMASETEKKNAKAALVAREVDKRYKDVIISAADVQEVEAKYTNTKQKNMAIVAKTMEKTAMMVQSVKHAFSDAKQEVLGFVNGLNNLDDNAIIALRKGLEEAAWNATDTIKENLGKNLTDQSWQGITNAVKQDVTSLTVTLDTYRKTSKITTEDEAKQIRNLAKDREVSVQKVRDEVKSLESALKLQKAHLKENSGNSKVMEERRKIINDEIFGLSKALAEEKKRLKVQEDILSTQKNLVDEYDLNVSMTFSDKLLSNLTNYGKESAQQLKVQQIMADNFIATISKKGKIEETDKATAAERIKLLSKEWETKSQAILQLEFEISKTEDLVKKNKKLTIEDKARLENRKEALKTLQDEQVEMTKLIGTLQNIVAGIFKKDKGPAKPAQGMAAAWEAEYGRILRVIKRGNTEAVAAIEEEFGSLDKGAIRKKLIDKNDQILQMEKQYAEKRLKQIADLNDKLTAEEAEYQEFQKKGQEEFQKILDRHYEEAKKASDDLLGVETRSAEDTKKKSDEKELEYSKRLDASRKYYTNLEAAALKHLETMRALYLELAASEAASLEQKNKAASDLAAAEAKVKQIRESAKSDAVKIEKDREKELKAVRDEAKKEIISYGEEILRSSANSMYEALTISNAALKESAMSRSEMLRRALKDTLESISKEAFVRMWMEIAYGAAAVATGSPKASAHFAAAAAFGAVAGVSLATSKGISAPSDSELARRKEKMNAETQSNSSASVGGTSSGSGTKIINIYWPNGVILGSKDSIVKQLKEAEDEASRRGRL